MCERSSSPIAYDGTAFAGWQLQANQRTVQGVLEDALRPIEGDARRRARRRPDRRGRACRRTGRQLLAGVDIARDALLRALNVAPAARCARDAGGRSADGFNAQFDARRKTYRYAICNARGRAAAAAPLRLARAAAARCRGDERGGAVLLGEHDFAAFQAAGSDVITSRRELLRLARRPRAMSRSSTR